MPIGRVVAHVRRGTLTAPQALLSPILPPYVCRGVRDSPPCVGVGPGWQEVGVPSTGVVVFSVRLRFPATPDSDCFVLVQPTAHRGRASIQSVTRSAASGRLIFHFQRQQYEFVTPDEAAAVHRVVSSLDDAADHSSLAPSDDTALYGAGVANGGVRVVLPDVSSPVTRYLAATGLAVRDVDAHVAQFGRNVVSIPSPSFVAMYVEQLLSPIAMFQIFCAVLWLMDAYWQYTAFSLISVLMLESMTTFQRLRTFSTLHGMCPKPYRLQVYRSGQWAEMSTQDLLPGDLISVFWHPKRREVEQAKVGVYAHVSLEVTAEIEVFDVDVDINFDVWRWCRSHVSAGWPDCCKFLRDVTLCAYCLDSPTARGVLPIPFAGTAAGRCWCRCGFHRASSRRRQARCWSSPARWRRQPGHRAVRLPAAAGQRRRERSDAHRRVCAADEGRAVHGRGARRRRLAPATGHRGRRPRARAVLGHDPHLCTVRGVVTRVQGQ